jgi:hypothetical protein
MKRVVTLSAVLLLVSLALTTFAQDYWDPTLGPPPPPDGLVDPDPPAEEPPPVPPPEPEPEPEPDVILSPPSQMVKAERLADAAGVTVQQVVQMRITPKADGTLPGWGEVAQALGVNPRVLGNTKGKGGRR